jgi:hypothetical protein
LAITPGNYLLNGVGYTPVTPTSQCLVTTTAQTTTTCTAAAPTKACWFKFTVPAGTLSAAVKVIVVPTGFDASIDFYAGTAAAPIYMQCVNAAGSGATETLKTTWASNPVNPGTEYYFRVGSTIMPSKAVDDYVSAFAECCKAIGNICDLNHQPSIDFTSYTLAQSNANGHTDQSISSGSFYVGIDLENYAGSDKSSIFAGYNSNTDDIYAVLTFGTGATANTVRFDAFALFDEVVVFENNTAYVKF